MDLLEDAPGNNAHEFTVSELSGAVKRSIEDQFGRVRVRGEVGRVSRPSSRASVFRSEGRPLGSGGGDLERAGRAAGPAPRRGDGGDRDRAHDHLSRPVPLSADRRSDRACEAQAR